MEKNLHLSCPCTDSEFYLEFRTNKMPTLFCPFCCTELELEEDISDEEEYED